MSIIEELEEDAAYIEGNASYQFDQDQNWYSYDRKMRVVKNMKRAAELMRNLGVGKRPFESRKELPYIPI